MPDQAHRQSQNVETQKKQRDEHESLSPFLVADSLRDVAKLCGPAQPKDQKKEKPAKKIREEVKRVARPRVRHSLGLSLMRKRVLFRPGLFRSLRSRKRTLRRTALLRRGQRRPRFRMRRRRGY